MTFPHRILAFMSSLWIHNEMFFMGWSCQPHNEPSTTRTKLPYLYGLEKVWPQFYSQAPSAHFDCLLHYASLQFLFTTWVSIK